MIWKYFFRSRAFEGVAIFSSEGFDLKNSQSGGEDSPFPPSLRSRRSPAEEEEDEALKEERGDNSGKKEDNDEGTTDAPSKEEKDLDALEKEVRNRQ